MKGICYLPRSATHTSSQGKRERYTSVSSVETSVSVALARTDVGLRLRLHDNAGGENARKSFRMHGSFTRYEEQSVKVVDQHGRKPKRWPRWKNLKTEMFCRINVGV